MVYKVQILEDLPDRMRLIAERLYANKADADASIAYLDNKFRKIKGISMYVRREEVLIRTEFDKGTLDGLISLFVAGLIGETT